MSPPVVSRSRFRFFDRDVILETDAPRVARDAEACYARFLLPSGAAAPESGPAPLVVRATAGGSSRGPSVKVGGRRLRLSGSEELSERAQLVLVCAAAAHRADRVVLHAGAVALGGRGVLLVGPTGWGKTTLTAALVMRGWRYLSDEFAPLTPDGLVHPFPRALRLVPPEAAASNGRARSEASSTRSRARPKVTMDAEELVPGCVGVPATPSAVFLLGGCRRKLPARPKSGWRLRLDGLPPGLADDLAAVPGVVSVTLPSRQAIVDVEVAPGARVVPGIDAACRRHDAAVLDAWRVGAPEPRFGAGPLACPVALATAMPFLLAHTVGLSARRFLYAEEPSKALEDLALLHRALATAGTTVFNLWPGAVGATADLVASLGLSSH